MAKLTAESFLAVVRQSGLIEQDQLKRLVGEFKQRGVNLEDSRTLADEFVARNSLTRWQADKLLQGKHKGFFLGKYRLLSLLGKGGMSSVYLAEHVLMRRRCAIKVLPSKRVHDTSYLARFHREAQAVASLDHSNIVRAYDVDKEVERDTEIHFLVMEYVEGQDLQDLVLKNGPLTYIQAADYIRQAADGLAHAHRAGMVHRDIKPGNLLVDTTGVVKILDLGLARFFDDQGGESLTVAHDEKVLGTADYLAPEQALDSHQVDARADIYSLGCTLYFVLTGHPPFTEGTLAQRLMAHQTKQPPPIENDRPDIPPGLLAIARKMMAKDRDERYQTAADVADSLAGWLVNHAGDEWRLKNPALVGGGSGSGTKLAAASQANQAGAAGSPSPAAPPTPAPGGRPPVAQPVAGANAANGPAASPASKPTPIAQPVHAPAPAASSPPSVAAPVPLASPAASRSTAEESGEDQQLAAFLSNLGQSDSGTKLEPVKTAGALRVPAAAAESTATATAAKAKSPAAAPVLTAQPVNAKPVSAHDSQSSSADRTSVPLAAPVPAVPVAKPISADKEGRAVATARPVHSPKTTASAPAFHSDSAATATFPEPAHAAFNSEPSATATSESSSAYSRKKRKRGASSFDARKFVHSLTEKLPAKHRSTILAAAAGLLTVALAFAAYSFFSGPTDTGGGTGGGKGGGPTAPLTAEITVGPDGNFKTISDALIRVRQDFHPEKVDWEVQTVKVFPGTYNERIVIDNSNFTYQPGIRVVADSGGPVVLAPSAAGPIVSLTATDNFTFEGFELKADGKAAAVELSGFCPGTRLVNLKITGFQESGVFANGADGFPSFIDFDHLTFAGGSPNAAGIRFESKGVMAQSRLKITNCRFHGPLAAGLHFIGDTKSVEIRESIFDATAAGIRFSGGADVLHQVAVGNNTFYKAERGIVFDELPNEFSSGGLAFFRNLFADVKTEAVIGANANPQKFASMLTGGGINHNWTSRPKPATAAAGEIDLITPANGRWEVKDFAFASTERGHAKFLAPSDASPHKKIEDASGSAKPYIGAVGP